MLSPIPPGKRTLTARLSAIIFTLAAAARLTAQVPASQASAGASETAVAGREETILLSPFEVNASTDIGYQAQNTLAGSRLNTGLKDTPATIDVFTKELLADIGATSLEQAMAYANNAEIEFGDTQRSFLGTEQMNPQAAFQFRSRGVGATRARNYFETLLPLELYVAERLDEARGPNSILFGIGSAGGLVNTTVKRASATRDFAEIETRTGSYNLFRTTADINRIIARNRLGLRLNLMSDRQDSWRDFLYSYKRGAHAALSWNPLPSMQIRADYEIGSLRGTITRNWTVRDGITKWWANGSPTSSSVANAAPSAAEAATGLARLATAGRITYVPQQDFVYSARNEWTSTAITQPEGGVSLMRDPVRMPYESNVSGPGGRTLHDYKVGGVSIEQRLSPALFAELAFHHEDGSWDNYDIGFDNIDLRGDPNLYLRNPSEIVAFSGYNFATSGSTVVNPNGGGTYVDVNWRLRSMEFISNAGRLSLSYEKNLGKLGRHRLAVMAQRSQTYSLGNSKREVVLGAPFNAGPVNANNHFWRRRYVTFGDSRSFAAPDWAERPSVSFINQGRQLSTGFVSDSLNESTRYVNSGLLALQSFWLDGRLVTTAGYRRDLLRQDRTETTLDRTGIWAASNGVVALDPSNVSTFKAAGNTQTAGAMLHLFSWMSVYGNQSNNINTPDFVRRMGIDGAPPPPPSGKGRDAGLQFDLLDGKVFARVAAFKTESRNQANQMGVNNAFGPNYNAILNALAGRYSAAQMAKYPHLRPSTNMESDTLDSAAEGYEARLTANVANGLRLIANYSYTDQEKNNTYPRTRVIYDELAAFVRDIGAGDLPNPNLSANNGATIAEYVTYLQNDIKSRALDFEQSFGSRKHKVSVFANYAFRGERLRGLQLGGGVRWQSGMGAGYNPATLQPYYGNAIFLVDAMVRYQWRPSFLSRWRAPLTLQVNVRNLLDDQSLLRQRLSDDGTQVTRFSFQTPRELVFSAGIKF